MSVDNILKIHRGYESTAANHPGVPYGMIFDLEQISHTFDIDRDSADIFLISGALLPALIKTDRPDDFVLDISDDYVPWIRENLIRRPGFFLDVFHNYPDQGRSFDDYKQLQDLGIIVITNAWSDLVDGVNVIYNDFLFNRTKAYYCQYPWSTETYSWYHTGPGTYQVPDIKKQPANRLFVAPNKIYHNDRPMRQALVDLLESYQDVGYLGITSTDPSKHLYAQIEHPWASIWDIVERQRTVSFAQDSGSYSPPHVDYYNDSYISIYTESIETGSSIAVTEKTYDPMIKGHFVLPFSCAGLIGFLKDRGFLFPDFIDYAYDSISDDQERFRCYSDEVRRLIIKSNNWWHEKYIENLDLLLHNQRLFHTRSFDLTGIDWKKHVQT